MGAGSKPRSNFRFDFTLSLDELRALLGALRAAELCSACHIEPTNELNRAWRKLAAIEARHRQEHPEEA